jgi:GTP pyrophosphokinase
VNSTSKTQIDRLGDRLRKGKFGDEELRHLDEFRRTFAAAYEEVVSTVRKTTQLDPTGRPAKSTTSIVEKLRRETIRLTQMQDIAGCRLVVHDLLNQDQVVDQLVAALPGAVVVDRRKEPSHGYRAVHVIATAQGKPVEIQVRTELQHLWAQLSEKLSDVVDPAIKYGGGDTKIREATSGLSDSVRALESVELMLEGSEWTPEEAIEPSQLKKRMAELLLDRKKQLRQAMEESITRLEVLSTGQTGGNDALPD